MWRASTQPSTWSGWTSTRYELGLNLEVGGGWEGVGGGWEGVDLTLRGRRWEGLI